MSFGMNRPRPNRDTNPLHPPKSDGDDISLEEMQAAFGLAAEAAANATAQFMPSLSEKINGLNEENNKFRQKLKKFKKENAATNQRIGSVEDQNYKQGEIIRALESSQERLQKELEKVKKEIRIEIEEKASTFSTENDILTKKLEVLTKEFEAVENENKELKRSLEELTKTVYWIREEHQKTCETLECKEAKLGLGQVAWILEAEIWKAVLPGETMGVAGILNSMERWLKKNSLNDKGKAAKKRWDDLKGKLNWDEDDHRWALKHLKKLRNKDAHPDNVDLEVARKQLNEGDYVAHADKKSCEEIIDMVETARKLNN